MILKWLSYPRSVMSGVLALIWTLFWSALAVLGAYIFNGARWWGDFISYNWGRGLLFFFNIKVHVEGLENLNSENGIFIFNHSSHFDIPILFVALRSRSIRFGAKAELFKIPVFGQAMRSVGALEIHRDKREKVIELYKKSLVNLNEGLNYILAPEGTRQQSGVLGDFKMGPFIMAISGQCPVHPVVIFDAYKIMPKHATFPAWGQWSYNIKVKVLSSEPTRGLSLDDKQKLKDLVRSKILQTQNEL